MRLPGQSRRPQSKRGDSQSYGESGLAAHPARVVPDSGKRLPGDLDTGVEPCNDTLR